MSPRWIAHAPWSRLYGAKPPTSSARIPEFPNSALVGRAQGMKQPIVSPIKGFRVESLHLLAKGQPRNSHLCRYNVQGGPQCAGWAIVAILGEVGGKAVLGLPLSNRSYAIVLGSKAVSACLCQTALSIRASPKASRATSSAAGVPSASFKPDVPTSCWTALCARSCRPEAVLGCRTRRAQPQGAAWSLPAQLRERPQGQAGSCALSSCSQSLPPCP